MDAFKAMQQAGHISDDINFKANIGFRRRFNLESMLICVKSGSADQEVVQFAKVALPKVLAHLRLGSAFNVMNYGETGLRWVVTPGRT